MSYIIKNTSGLINTKITDAGRKKMSQGNFNISYFQVGDSEVCYNCVNNINQTDSYVLMPQDNSQSLSPSPEKNRMHVKYPFFIDSSSGATYGVPIDTSYIDNIFNSAAPRGFFTGSTTSGFTLYTTSAYTINPNFVISNGSLITGSVITLSATSVNPSVSGTASVGMLLTLFTQNSLNPLSGNTPIFTYKIIGITGDTSSASTVTVELDRNVPNYSILGLSGNSSAIFYPEKMIDLYDSFTPEPYWDTDVFNFESNCDLSVSDVKVWNMNSPWTESPAGIFNNTYQDYNYYESTGYTGSKEYFGYNSQNGQIDSDSVYYYNSFSEKIKVKPIEQKAIAIVHYTNQSIDNYYGEKFAMQDFDPVNSGNTGQARNFKLSIPWLMWHKNPNKTMGEDFYTDPAGFTSLNLFEIHYIKSKLDIEFNNPGLRYYHLWDTHANLNGYPSRVGKVFPDLKMIVFDDDEIVATLNSKSNRSWTLPAPKLGTILPNTLCGGDGNTIGLLSGTTDTLYLTYRFNNTAFTDSLHCNYYTKLNLSDENCGSNSSYDILVRFGNEFPFLLSELNGVPSGYTANTLKILAQKVTTGTTRPNPSQWKEIDVSSQISATTFNNYLTTSGLTGTTFQITKNMYDGAPTYNLSNYLTLPQLNQTGTTFNFGGDYYFFGNIQTDIQATIYVMNFLCNLGQTQFFDSSNPTWDNTKTPYVTEVGLYNAEKELMVISKIQSPQKRQGIQQYPIKIDF